ncbi:MAG: hypothetical protein WCD89_17475 [Anaerocolumna sp.]
MNPITAASFELKQKKDIIFTKSGAVMTSQLKKTRDKCKIR